MKALVLKIAAVAIALAGTSCMTTYDAYGRPVGVAIDGQGALLVADDVGNTIWRVTSANAQRSAAR